MIRHRLQEVDPAKIGSLVLYFSGSDWRHIGTETGLHRVASQWGTYPIYEHGLCEVPERYGDVVRFFDKPPPGQALADFLDYARSEGVSSALTEREFLQFQARMLENRTTVAGTKLKEFSATIDKIARRSRGGSLNFILADARTSLLKLTNSQTSLGVPCEMYALSPSHADKLDFFGRLAALMPRARTTKRSLSAVTPNEVSMVTLINVGQSSILLGADLENSGKQTSGLEAVVVSNRTAALGASASFFKVGHHGSMTAYNPNLWTEMVMPDATAAITPWRKGGRRIPTKDSKLFLTHSNDIYISASDARSQLRPRSPAVRRQLQESNVRLRSLVADTGMLRFRAPAKNLANWKVKVLGDACHLRQFLRRKETR